MKHHHFLIISFPIQSHINPTLQLAKNLARAGAKVTFATTVRGLRRVQQSLPILTGLSYASFSDGHDEENNPSGSDYTGYMADFRRFGSENLTKILQKFVNEGQSVTCLVYTLLVPWAAAVAREMHVPSAFLAIQCATAFAIYHRFFNSHDGIHAGGIASFSSLEIPGLPMFSSGDLPTFLFSDNPMNAFLVPLMLEHIQEIEKDNESLVFLNTFEELEQEAVKAFDNKLNVIAIGPLVPSAFYNAADSTDKPFGGDMFSKNEDYFQWLDSKPEKSVVYVAFGSLVVMNRAQKVEILHGLLESKRPFLWVIRSGSEEEEEEEMKKMLENELNNGDGIIVPWCSQTEVLSHNSIGCFVTHCGWNSILESLVCGVPLICCPCFSDQTTNAKLVEEVWGTGVRARINEEVVMERGELRKCLDMVMGHGERGKDIRRNAQKWRGLAIEAVRDGGSTYNNLRKVLESSRSNS
ncbi:UDP-glycosyltransferase 75C1 [Sesamum alatum]|uniref:Glycosyltransferase n=1 Tax=Sesamum alatum TaxID=300844 RepID=A0AAE1XPK1_9LAMI|nr:UDP-glycosyltransferase 75C1 [Sesamum alatum]